jgi:hypothetical protein
MLFVAFDGGTFGRPFFRYSQNSAPFFIRTFS